VKLPRFSIVAAEMVLRDGAYYLLDRFEIELDSQHTLYGIGTLRVQPKKDSIEYALSAEGGIYLDAAHTQKVGLSEFLK
jgi:hypothetical protein